MIADSRINFDLYFSLKDDIQNALAAVPATPAVPLPVYAKLTPAPAAAVQAPAPAIVMVAPAASVSDTIKEVSPFKLTLSSDRGTNPSYKVGEFLSLKMSMNQLGFASCFYEDTSRVSARIFPNRFHRDSMLKGYVQIPLPTGGFKIKLDRPGREQVACMASDRELVVPSNFSGISDLSPLPVKSLDDVIGLFKKFNPTMTVNFVEITVR